MSFELPKEGSAAEIAILPAAGVHLHEAVVATHVDELIEAIERDGLVRDPVIVSRESSVVLDGMHRVSAVRSLGLEGVPACIVDYDDPAIAVGSWYRTFHDLEIDTLDDRCSAAGLTRRPVDPAIIGRRTWPAAPIVVSPDGAIELGHEDGPIATLKHTLRVLDELRSIGHDPRLVPDTEFTGPSAGSLTVAIPPPDKAAVVRAATGDAPFPANTSRHVIPARPMAVDASLELLAADPATATATLDDRLADRRLDQLPPGSDYDGRHYEESLLVFR